MKMRKVVLVFVLLTSMLLLVASCGTEPVSMSDIPVFLGAEPMAQGQNDMADQMADVIKESSGGEGVTAEVNLYSLPVDTTWEDVKTFYNDGLSGTDWQTEADLAQDTEFFSSLGWSRGSGASEQALVVGYVADIVGSGAFLIVVLFSE